MKSRVLQSRGHLITTALSLLAFAAIASAEQTATPSGAQNPAPSADQTLPAQEGRLNAGTCVIINNLFKKLNANGEFVLLPLEVAVNDSQCPQLRDYSRIKGAYFELAQNPAHPRCSSIDPKSAVIGTICSTTKGGKFKRYQNPTSGELGWQDLEADGIVWYDEEYLTINHHRSSEVCSTRNQVLPTRQEYHRAFGRGVFEVLRPPQIESYFWTRDIGSRDQPSERQNEYAFTYSTVGYGGAGIPRASANQVLRARCVGNSNQSQN